MTVCEKKVLENIMSLLNCRELNDWEENFVYTMQTYRLSDLLTDEQSGKLYQIWLRINGQEKESAPEIEEPDLSYYDGS